MGKYDFGIMTPVPELIMPGKWRKANTGEAAKGGSVDISKKQFNSPWDGSDESVAIRAHEYLHIKYSPPKDMINSQTSSRGKAFETAIMSLEDERVNYIGVNRHDMDLTAIAKVPLKMPPTGFPPFIAASLYLSGIQYKDKGTGDKLLAMIPEDKRKRLPEVLDILYKNHDDFSGTTMAAQKLLDIFTNRPEGEAPGGKGEKELDASLPGMGEAITRADKASKDKIEFLHATTPSCRPGVMKIVKPRLSPARSCKVHVGRGRRPDEYGMVFQYPERYVTDKACFSSLKKEGMGTILFDISGSMSLSDEQVLEVMTYANNATIATYTGDGSRGELTIVAQGGKVSREAPTQLGGNIVDFPALQWLSKQRGPRIWICDGIVTGCNDKQSDQYTEACFEISTKMHAIRFSYPQAFIDALKSRKSIKASSEYAYDEGKWWKTNRRPDKSRKRRA